MKHLLPNHKLSRFVRNLFSFIVLSMSALSYSQQLLKATLTTISNTRSNTIHLKKHNLLQSIGQSGMTGAKSFNNIAVQQGFLTNNAHLHITNSDADIIDESFELTISPNPFIDHVRIKFSKQTKHAVYIKMHDINGKLIFSKKQSPTDNLYIPMHNYSFGTYLLQIQSGANSFTKKLLKSIQQ